jgi:hypothetical protein
MRNASHNTRNTSFGILFSSIQGQIIEAPDLKEESVGSARGVATLRFGCLSLESDKQALDVYVFRIVTSISHLTGLHGEMRRRIS